jgi:hypothetical protein
LPTITVPVVHAGVELLYTSAFGAPATTVTLAVPVRVESVAASVAVVAFTRVMLAVPTPATNVTVAGYVGVAPEGLFAGPLNVIVCTPEYAVSVVTAFVVAVSVTLNGVPAVCVPAAGERMKVGAPVVAPKTPVCPLDQFDPLRASTVYE